MNGGYFFSSHLMTNSASVMTPESRPMSEFGILKVEKGEKRSRQRASL